MPGAFGQPPLRRSASAPGTSRTSFATRFLEAIGQPPGACLTEWRLLRARRLGTESTVAMPDIVERVGHTSEAGFARACKRRFGETPAQLRRTGRSHEPKENVAGSANSSCSRPAEFINPPHPRTRA